MSDATPSSSPASAGAAAPSTGTPAADATASGAKPDAQQKPSPKPSSTGARGADGKFTGGTTGTPQPPVEPAPKRTIRFKAPGGEDMELDEERAAAELSMGLGFKKKFTEFDQQKKQFEQLVAQAKQNPDALLKHLGMDPDEWAEQRAWQRIRAQRDEESLTPEQRAERALAGEREKFERERQEWQQQLDRHEQDQHVKQVVPLLQQHIPAALEQVGLPHSGMALERMRSYLSDANEAGQPLTPALIQFAAQSAREEIGEAAKGLVADMSAPQIISFFGEDVANKIRAHDLEQFEKAHGGGQPAQAQQPAPRAETPKYLTDAQVARFNRTGRYDP
jgi:hypothetical protein